MKRKYAQKLKRIVSMLLSLTMLTNMSAALPANALERSEQSSNHYSLVGATEALNYKGDVNGDGKITDDDTTLLTKWLVHLIGDNEIILENADVNLDGKADILDIVELSRFCKSTQISEGEDEYENVYTPEPRARVILDSIEKTETKMTEEMADLADHLKTPLAVYEYLYNNVNVEFYIGSRKGAIGTYEQNGGNDVDCASLLIAMLRYLGYDAEYVTGEIGVTEKQLLELTGTDSVDDALSIIGIHYKKISKKSKYYCFTHTWVRTVINGESYDLDISLKKYKQVLSLNDAVKYANKNYSDDELLDITNISAFQNLFHDEEIVDPNSAFSFAGRAIVQKPIKELPTATYFIYENESEIVSDICDSKIILRDEVTFTISGESKTYYSSDLYVDDITIGYTFNPEQREEWYWYGLDLPDSVYDISNEYGMIGVRLDASPAIYINNKIDFTWNEKTSVINSNDLKITVLSSGCKFDFDKTIDCGSINAFEFDFQNISAQEIITSHANMPSEDDIGKIDSSKYRDSDYFKNYLTLMGAMYFSECDIQEKMISSSLNVRQEKFLSFGVFSYNADVKDYEFGYGGTFEDTGSLEVDILDNTYIQKSYTGNKDDERSFHFMSGLAHSYQESEILEQFTEESSVSTVSVLETAMDMDVPIICINSQNIDRLNSLGLYDTDKEIIREAVKTGAYVTVPERNIKIGRWTGTGYIIQNNDTGDLSFKITGAINGGSTVNKATQDALQKYALICGSVAFVDTVCALYSSVMIMSNAVMSLIYASSTFGVIGGAAALGAGIALMNAAMKSYQAAVKNCFLVLEGDPEAAIELLIDTELTLIVDVLGELGGITASAIKNKIAKDYIESSLPDELLAEIYKTFECSEETLAKFIKTTKNAGIGSDCLILMLKDPSCIDNYSKKVLKQLGKLEKEAQYAIIDGIQKCSKDLPDILKKLDKDGLERFFNAVSKYADEVFEQLAKSTNVNDAVVFISKYSNEGAELFVKNSDMAVEAVNRLDNDSVSTFFKYLDEGSYEASEVVEYINGGNATTISEKDIENFVSHEIDEVEETALITKSNYSDIFQKNGRITELKPNNDYYSGSDLNHAQYKYHTDEAGRIESVSGKLERHDGTRNSYAQSHVGRGDRITTKTHPDMEPDDGGHLIATIFNGDGNIDNLVPMNRNLNRGPWESMEKDWAGLLEKQYDVEVSISVVYPEGSSSFRPESFTIKTVVTDPNTGIELANEITNFDNISGQTYERIKLKQ